MAFEMSFKIVLTVSASFPKQEESLTSQNLSFHGVQRADPVCEGCGFMDMSAKVPAAAALLSLASALRHIWHHLHASSSVPVCSCSEPAWHWTGKTSWFSGTDILKLETCKILWMITFLRFSYILHFKGSFFTMEEKPWVGNI